MNAVMDTIEEMKYGIGKFEETELVKVPGYDDIEDVREYVTGPIGKRGERLEKMVVA